MRTEHPARLAPFLGGALLLHGVAGLLWPATLPPAGMPDKPRLFAALRPVEAGSRQPLPGPPAARSGLPAGPALRAGTTGKRPVAPIAADIPIAPAPVTTRLLDEARAMLNKESRQRMLDPMFAPAAKAAAVDSPLARTMARPKAGERMLGDGVLQLTTADGKVHCLQKPSEIASRDIPGGSFAIPVNCPF